MKAWAQVPQELLTGGFSDRAVRVYGLLVVHSNRDGVASPSRATLAALARCSTDSVDRALLELVEAGAVKVVRGGGGRVPSTYHLEAAPVPTQGPHGCGGSVRKQGQLEAAPVRQEGEKFLERTRAPARTRARAREDHLDQVLSAHAAGLGEFADVVESWNRNVGIHYAFDEKLYREELDRVFGKRVRLTPDIEDELLDEARSLVAIA